MQEISFNNEPFKDFLTPLPNVWQMSPNPESDVIFEWLFSITDSSKTHVKLWISCRFLKLQKMSARKNTLILVLSDRRSASFLYKFWKTKSLLLQNKCVKVSVFFKLILLYRYPKYKAQFTIKLGQYNNCYASFSKEVSSKKCTSKSCITKLN